MQSDQQTIANIFVEYYQELLDTKKKMENTSLWKLCPELTVLNIKQVQPT